MGLVGHYDSKQIITRPLKILGFDDGKFASAVQMLSASASLLRSASARSPYRLLNLNPALRFISSLVVVKAPSTGKERQDKEGKELGMFAVFHLSRKAA